MRCSGGSWKVDPELGKDVSLGAIHTEGQVEALTVDELDQKK